MNMATVHATLNSWTKMFARMPHTQEEQESFIIERNSIMLAATGEPYYAWYIG